MHKYWVAFWVMGFIYGASFPLNSVALRQLTPVELGVLRYTIAAIGLHIYLRRQRISPALNPTMLGRLMLVGLGNHALPFTLILWAQVRIDSGMTSVLMATAPLFSLVIAHFAFADERMSVYRVAGVTLGFSGVVILANGDAIRGDLVAGLAILAGSALSAAATIYSRGVLRGSVNALVATTGALTTSAIFMAIVMLTLSLTESGALPTFFTEASRTTWLTVLTLGLGTTMIANALYYFVIQGLGAARATQVMFVFPPISLILGATFLHEALDAQTVLAMLVIFSGLALVNSEAAPAALHTPRLARIARNLLKAPELAGASAVFYSTRR